MKFLKWIKSHPWMWISLLVVILITLSIMTFGREGISKPESFLGSVVLSVRNAVNQAGQFFGDMFQTGKLREDIANLLEENLELKHKNSQLEQLELENEKLQKLLDYSQDNQNLDPIAALVIAKSPGNWFTDFEINRGSDHGIQKDMAVVDENGLIGRISQVGSNWAKVVSIVDSRSAVAVMIERTRDDGILRGNYALGHHDELCRLFYLPIGRDLLPGDKVITSGTDKLYPKGLLVGEVSQVSTDQKDAYDIVSPVSDFAHIEMVLVLRFSQTD